MNGERDTAGFARYDDIEVERLYMRILLGRRPGKSCVRR